MRVVSVQPVQRLIEALDGLWDAMRGGDRVREIIVGDNLFDMLGGIEEDLGAFQLATKGGPVVVRRRR